MQTVLEAIGWIGSILVVVSLTQARVLRFRWMNLAGSVVATFYNLALGIWPFVAMNGAIAVINIYWLARIYRERHDDSVYRAIALDPEDPYLQHVLQVHARDIAQHRPDFAARAMSRDGRRATFLVAHGDEPVGVVAVRDEGDGVGLVELDWVKPKYRDFTPGEFVYGSSHVLTDAGFRRIEVDTHEALDREYLRKMGFRTERTRWVLDLDA